ncbi:hypothetical protein [Nocardia sp. N2S4-5]|uniref:hypothetical protein n=1 Tax=Nocardia sp. N2S4-5 TaxID=3351565 RepID=UPI0037CEB5B5
MSDEQMGFDIEFDDTTQAFLKWATPELMESQVRAFLKETVPGIADYSDEWWKRPLLLRILEASKRIFGDWSDFIAPENRESADRFVRLIGECCIRQHPKMTWTKDTDYGTMPPLFAEFGPAVHDAATDDGVSMKSIVEWLFDDDGPRMVEFSIRNAGKAI